MVERNYANRELADMYYTIVAPNSRCTDTYRTLKRRIAESSIDLARFFQEYGSFDRLAIKGIGKGTKRVLELILISGCDLEEIGRTVQEKKEAVVRSGWSKFPSRAPRQNEDTSPSWDNAIRIYEDN
ncbi:hypothetical protein J4442_05140 [Candidatus Woesearchaeota archaeon]|nr:hypothetical protein [Candidatus Woesearchaeota archaeon]